MIRWHMITPEFPPDTGGVADYSAQVAEALEQTSDEVHVWPLRESDSWSALRRTGRLMDACPGPRRVLVQWVPHGYGRGGVNFKICFWLCWRALRGDRVDVVAHETFFDFSGGWRRRTVALLHRLMTVVLLCATDSVWVTIPAWETRLRRYRLFPGLQFRWLPVSASTSVSANSDDICAIRSRLVSEPGAVIGYFGIHGAFVTSALHELLPILLQNNSNRAALLIGKGSDEFREALLAKKPSLAGRVHSTGTVSKRELSSHLCACDLLLQPYPDGASGRRSSLVTALAYGVPTITTVGSLSEPFWQTSGAVLTAMPGDVDGLVAAAERALKDAGLRSDLSAAARKLYKDTFDMRLLIERLRSNDDALTPRMAQA